MAETKTRPTPASVADFLLAVDNPARRADAEVLCAMLTRMTGEVPRMWGSSIIGFGSYHYKYDSGHEGTSCRIGFSPRKAELVLYVVNGFPAHADIMARLGKHKTGKSCLYIRRLSDIDMGVLAELCAASIAVMDERYPRV